MANTSAVAKKLNLKDGMSVLVIGRSDGVDLEDIAVTNSPGAESVIAFARKLADLDTAGGPVISAAAADRIAWFAYPKAGQLDTDLNRDILARHIEKAGVKAVRQVSIDTVWSALRFRPGK